ncbi:MULTISPECIES: YppE family protein [Bacillaceae]|uniref:YppE family protein n=1 Tax=Bacillaceae TaxID=186817 RepID=UPI00067154A6|nr:YppE family protein [Bacillus sp. FJAT-27916]
MTKELAQLTELLLSKVAEAEEIYRQAREEEKTFDFYQVIKPYADEVKELADRWEDLAKEWQKAAKPKHISPLQIQNTHNNLLQVSVHCHIPQSSKSRFIKHCNASAYVLEQVKQLLS